MVLNTKTVPGMASKPPSSSASLADDSVKYPPATFIIDPLSLVGMPQDVFRRFVETLQVLSFTLLREDFSGSAEQVEYLEKNVTFLDVIVAGRIVETQGLTRFTVKQLCLPTDASSWVRRLCDDSLAQAKALIPVAIEKFKEDIESGALPAWIAGDLWIPSDLVPTETSEPTMDWTRDVVPEDSPGSYSHVAKRPRPDPPAAGSSVSVPETVNPSAVETAQVKTKKKDKTKAVPTVPSVVKPLSNTYMKGLKRRRKSRTNPLLGSLARLSAIDHAEKSKISKLLSFEDSANIISAFKTCDLQRLISCSKSIFRGITCHEVPSTSPFSADVKDIAIWRTIPTYVYSSDPALRDYWNRAMSGV